MSAIKESPPPVQCARDFEIDDEGSLVLFWPKTEAARDWVREHVDVPGHLWIGPRFACEHWKAVALIAGMLNEGFAIQ